MSAPAKQIAPRIAPDLASALAKAQGEFPTIRKDHTATVQTKSGGQYQYGYADLATVLEAVRPALSKHELALVQLPSVRMAEGATFVGVETILAHSSGHSMSAALEISVSDASAQAIGSALTYARRYSVLSILGVAAEEEDDDGGAAQPPPQARPSQRRQAAAKKSAKELLATKSQLKLLWAKTKAKAHEFVAEGDTEAEKQLAEEILRSALKPAGLESTKNLGRGQVDAVLERIEAFTIPAENGAQESVDDE